MKKLFTFVVMALCAIGASAQTYDNEAITATWSMADGAASACVVAPEEAVVSSNWEMGSNIVLDATVTGVYFEKTFTRFTNLVKQDNKRSKLADNWIDFTFTVKDGLTFTADKVTFDMIKIGTGDPKIYVDMIAGGKTTVLGDDVVILRDNASNSDEVVSGNESQAFDVADKNISSTSGVTLRIYIGKLADNKQVGIANVVISGKVSGTASNKATYTVNVTANPAEGGTVATSAKTVTEGDEVTLTAKANRGYSFVNWTDGTGTEVSKEAVYTFVPTADVDYIANFAAADVRTLNVTVNNQEAGEIVIYGFEDEQLVTDGRFFDGNKVVIEARNKKGYLFKEWSDGETKWQRDTLTVDGDVELQAIFKAVPETQALVYFPLTSNTNETLKSPLFSLKEFVYCDDDEQGFSLDGAVEALDENMQKFTYPTYDAADPASKVDSTFYVNLEPVLEDGQVYVISSIEFNAMRNGTDAGDWKVSIVRDNNEDNAEVIAENFKPNRNSAKTLSHYYFNVSTKNVAEQSAQVRITICAPGNNKSYNLSKLRIQGYICAKTAVGISEVATEQANRGVVYNLAGQRVSGTQKGLYIRDGKKFVK